NVEQQTGRSVRACLPPPFPAQCAALAAAHPLQGRKISRYGDLPGPLATIDGEPRQARKGATVAVDSCAGVWLGRSPPVSPSCFICISTTPDKSHSVAVHCGSTKVHAVLVI